jgi:DNA polymerase-1
MAFLSRKLVTIVTDVPLGTKFDELKMKPLETEPVRELLRELGFGSFERKIFSDSTAAPDNPVTGRPVVKVKEEKAGAAPKAKKTKAKTLEPQMWTEEQWTLEELRKNVEPYSEIWALMNERGIYLGIQGVVVRINSGDHEIGEVLCRKNLRWKGYDVKQVLKTLNCPNSIVVWDGMLAAYIVRANSIPPFEEIYEQYCGKRLPDLCTMADQMTAQQELEILLRQKMVEQDGISVYDRFELPLVPVLVEMELKGIKIDAAELAEQGKGLGEDIKRLEKAIHDAAGESFNIGSPKQLGAILFEKLKLPVGHKTKTGYSTNSDVLEGLTDKHPIAKLILEYRELTKLKSTYVDALPAMADPQTGRVHTKLNQASTTTGRLSSTDPNLQNIPIRTDRGRLVRRAFIADKGNVLISADYSQIELRILAHITGDEGLTHAFREDLDIHAATASEIFAIDLKDVTANHRRIAKAVNFGLAYGQGAFGLADVLGIPRKEAMEIIDRYFKRFSGVKRYMEDTVKEAMEKGYVETLFGRRRYLDEMKSNNPNIRRSGERAAINAPIQGTASDLVKLAMIKVHESLPVPVLLQVHDELIFEAPKEDAEELCADIKTIMEGVHKLNVPLKVNVGSGLNWDDAH